MTEKIILNLVQQRLTERGIAWARLESLKIKRQEKSLEAEVSLDGEAEWIGLSLGYELTDGAIRITEAQASRPWIVGAIKTVLMEKGDRIPLPSGMVGSMARMVL